VFDSDSEIGGVVRQNWALLVAIGVLLGGAGFGYLYDRSEEDAISNVNVAAVVPGQAMAVTTAAQSRAERKTPQDLALEQIAEHEEKVQADHEDTPAYLAAMGNLYRQKMVDYEKAAECYERLLMDYKDWDGVRAVYMQLATCYERLDQDEKMISVYKQMLDVFPAESQEHQIAHAAVYR
jgi:tetratricopeptide (TPR) repeat protein